MGNLIYINVLSFVHDNKVYEWCAMRKKFITAEYWSEVTLESFHYELKTVPAGAQILRYRLVKGGQL